MRISKLFKMETSIIKENYSYLAEIVTKKLEIFLEPFLEKREYGNPRKNCSWGNHYTTVRYGNHYLWTLLYEDYNGSTLVHPLRMCTDSEIMFTYIDETGEHIADNLEDAIERYVRPFKEKKRKSKRFLLSISG